MGKYQDLLKKLDYLMSEDFEIECFKAMTDDELLTLWRGTDCPTCQRSVERYGMLADYCDECDVDRGADSLLWAELVARGLDK